MVLCSCDIVMSSYFINSRLQAGIYLHARMDFNMVFYIDSYYDAVIDSYYDAVLMASRC